MRKLAYLNLLICLILALIVVIIAYIFTSDGGHTTPPASLPPPPAREGGGGGGYAPGPAFGGDSGGECPDNSFWIEGYKKKGSCNSSECKEVCMNEDLNESNCTPTGKCCCGLRPWNGGLKLMGASTTTLLVVLLGSFVLLHDFLSS